MEATPGATASTAMVGTPAEFGSRAVAWLIDIVIPGIIYFVGFLLFLGDGIIGLLGILLILASFGFWVWNTLLQQGKTGQTIGKGMQGIKLVDDTTAAPVGIAKALIRAIVAAAMGLLCGVGQIADLLWPLFDDDKKRLTDKILNLSVVKA